MVGASIEMTLALWASSFPDAVSQMLRERKAALQRLGRSAKVVPFTKGAQ
jgi:hypothetical protein